MTLQNRFNKSQPEEMLFAVSEGANDFRVMTASVAHFERYGDINEAHCFIEAVERLQPTWEVFGKDKFTLTDVVKKYQQEGFGWHNVLQDYIDSGLVDDVSRILNPPSGGSSRSFKGHSPA